MEIDHYSTIASVREYLEPREEIVVRDLVARKATGKILDLGCGDGCFLALTCARLSQLQPAGLDLSPNQLKKAQKRMPTGRFVEGSLMSPLPFSDGAFDIVYSGEVIEHLFDPDFFLREIYRVLKPGGSLYMTTPNLFAWYNRLLIPLGISPLFVEYSTKDSGVGFGVLRRLKFQTAPAGHLRIFHPAAFRDIQTMYGFNRIRLWATAFEFFPKIPRAIDRLIATLWTSGGSILISRAEKSS